MCNGSNWGFSFLIMTYNILIDQRFAVANELTIVQTTTLAACMTLPTWTNTITVDGVVWYQYSESKMVDDFPLLFSIPKRVYKNIKELADRGFIELNSFGKKKYLRFTEKCKTWNRSETDFNQSENGLQDYNIKQQSENGLQDYNIKQQSENGLNSSPKTDFNQSENGLQDYNIKQQSENGLNSSPKTDFNQSENGLQDYNINNNNINSDYKESENEFSELFTENEKSGNAQRLRGTTEPCKCLFANSRFAKFEDFARCFDTPEFEQIDILYYYHSVADWSASKGKMQKDWIAQTRNFIRGDKEKGKLHLKPQYQQGKKSVDINGAMEFLNNDY